MQGKGYGFPQGVSVSVEMGASMGVEGMESEYSSSAPFLRSIDIIANGLGRIGCGASSISL